MSPRAKRAGGSAVEQLLNSIGVHHRADPFAHMAQETVETDWFHSRIIECIKGGTCPLCGAYKSSLSDYLFWLPANLRDADFFLSLYETGGFCRGHLEFIMVHLRGFPYSQVRFLMLLKMLIENCEFTAKQSCDLCHSLEESKKVYRFTLRKPLSSAEATREAEALTSCLCQHHAGYFSFNVTSEKGISRYETVKFQELRKPQKAALIKALDEIAREFHRMDIGELRIKLKECESLVCKAMPPDRKKSSRSISTDD